MLNVFVKILEDSILKFCSYFPKEIGFDIPRTLSLTKTICMECQSLFSGKNKKKIIKSSAEFVEW